MTSIDERRAAGRLEGESGLDGVTARIRPGHQVRVLNLSCGGVLVEGSRRLLPGTLVDVHLEREEEAHACRARVVHCAVSALHQHGVAYRAGLAFENGPRWRSLSAPVAVARVELTGELAGRS